MTVTKTQLTAATNELVDAVGRMFDDKPGDGLLDLHAARVQSVHRRHNELLALREEFDTAASNRRNTSIAASKLIEPKIDSIRRQILIRLVGIHARGFVGDTDDGLEVRTGMKHQTVSAARNALFETGWIRPSGEYRETRSGRHAIVWTLTDQAVTQIPDLLEKTS